MPDSTDKNQNLSDKPTRSISVFFPCYNEAENILPLVKKTREVLGNITDDFEIIIIDDGSTDNTDNIADSLAAQFDKVKVVRHQKNLGYGAALQSGFKAATKDLVFYTDSDGQFDINELPAIIPLIEKYDMVTCYRKNRQEGPIRKFNAYCWTKLVCLLFGMKMKDIDCAFKLFKREIFDNIEMKSTGALIDAEIFARATRKGYTFTQTGVSHYRRKTGKQTGANPAVILKAFKELFKLRKEIVASEK